jgi:hypothetical protein
MRSSILMTVDVRCCGPCVVCPARCSCRRRTHPPLSSTLRWQSVMSRSRPSPRLAAMLKALALTGRETFLEVGTGYGYQTALLARPARYVWSIERWADLAAAARANLATAGITPIRAPRRRSRLPPMTSLVAARAHLCRGRLNGGTPHRRAPGFQPASVAHGTDRRSARPARPVVNGLDRA